MRRKLRMVALAVFLVSQALPAFTLITDLVWGWRATGLSLLGVMVFNPACLFGATANVLFGVSFVTSFVSREHSGASSAWIAVGCAFVAVLLLAFGGQFSPHVGCAAWLLGMILLPVGCVRKRELVDGHSDDSDRTITPKRTATFQEPVDAPPSSR